MLKLFHKEKEQMEARGRSGKYRKIREVHDKR